MCQAQGEALNSDSRGGGAEHAQDRGLKGTHSLGGQDLAAWSSQGLSVSWVLWEDTTRTELEVQKTDCRRCL